MPELVLVDSVDEVENLLRWLGERRPVLAFDTETTGLDPYHDKIRMAQFGDGETAWAIPYRDWRGVVRHVLEVYDRPMIAWNMKFDASMAEEDGLDVGRHRFHDGMTMAHLIDSHGPKGLKSASKRYLGVGADHSQIVLKAAFKKHHWSWATVPETFEPYWVYAAMDTVLTARIGEKLWPMVQPYREAYELELAVTWVLLDMEQRGARIDKVYCEKMYEELTGELDEIRVRWPDIDILSTEQVRRALEAEGFLFTKKTEKGNISVDDEVLAQIPHPLAQDCRRARQCSKWSASYFGAYLRLEVDDIVHCNVNPLGAQRTGRMSISRPSMQNIPRLKLLRDAFIPRDGNRIVLTDYQAQETRLIAHFAREERMIEAFRSGVDIHRFVGSMVYGVDVGEVTPDQRYRSKTGGHARNYGARSEKLAWIADISLSEARGFVKRYDRAFPGIPRFNAEVVKRVIERGDGKGGYGYVMSYGGRKIMVPTSKAYAGVNYLIQGSGSDAIKRGLVNADRMGISEFAIIPVHDEVVWDIPATMLSEVLPEIHAAFEHGDLLVPLPIEEKVVERWGDAYV